MVKRNISPGEWHTEAQRIINSAFISNEPEPEQKSNPEVYFGEDLVAMQTLFRNQVFNPESVLYPSCGFDGSPAKVFRDVTFLDSEEGNRGCIELLKKLGFKALKQDITNYKPAKPHDLLILLNPQFRSELALPHLADRGFVLANNYHRNASQILAMPNFELLGTIDFSQNPVLTRGTKNLRLPQDQLYAFRRR